MVSDLETISAATLEAESGISKVQTSRWRKSLADQEAYHDKIVLAACRKAGLEPELNRVTPNSGENEWFTPAQYIEAAREVMATPMHDHMRRTLTEMAPLVAEWRAGLRHEPA